MGVGVVGPPEVPGDWRPPFRSPPNAVEMRGPVDVLSFDMVVWTTAAQVPPGGRDHLACPVCGEPLRLHQPEEDAPSRLLASCTCEECSIWLALAFTPDRSRVYMVRVPSTAEFWEALRRRDLADDVKTLPTVDGRNDPSNSPGASQA